MNPCRICATEPLVALLLLMPLGAVSAPMVLVGDEEGHAMLVRHRGNCYAVMPDHVAARERMTLISALPQTTGLAHVFHRVREMDIVLAYVEGDLLALCDQSWADFSRDLNPVFATSETGGLSRIQFNGQFIDRAEATIVDADDTHFEIVTSDQWANSEIMSGVSGALFYVNGIPVGIALSAENTNRARFLRLDRMFEALDTVLDKSGASHPVNLQISGADQGLGYRITSQVRLRNGTRTGLRDSLAAEWDGAQIELVFTLSNNLPVPLKQIKMQTDAADETVTFPQKIKLELDVGGQINRSGAKSSLRTCRRRVFLRSTQGRQSPDVCGSASARSGTQTEQCVLTGWFSINRRLFLEIDGHHSLPKPRNKRAAHLPVRL